MKKRRIKQSKPKKKNHMLTVIVLLLLVILSVTIYWYYQKDDVVIKKEHIIESIPEGFTSFGIDVSHHQGKINWERLMRDDGFDSVIQFVYCKATEGMDHIDTQWEYNRQELIKLNIAHGAYHFLALSSDPKEQAKHFLSQWNKSEFDLPPVLDVETEGLTDKELIAAMKIWLQEVEQKTGMRPIIYTSLHFYETKFAKDFSEYKFWIAAYSRRPNCLEDARILHWQYSEKGELPGIREKVDFNVSKITYL
jgi:lysozyme